MTKSIAAAVLQAAHELRKAGVTEARREAGSLMAHALGRDRSYVLSHADTPITEEQEQIFRAGLQSRLMGKPFQYITGHQEFFGLDFEVTSDVLIPRPETELLVEAARELILESGTTPMICDLGTGSGCIAISLLHELQKFPDAHVVAVDISEAALAVAERNAERHALTEQIDFILSDCFAQLDATKPFDAIVSNPPYVRSDDIRGLQREVRDFEPRLALEAGADGLSVVRRLLRDAPEFLKSGGHLLFEIGFDQSSAVEQSIDRNRWKLLDIHKDLQGIPRVVALKKSG